MFRKMRRFAQQLPQEECERILQTATSGVLAVIGDEGYPYAVPVSHVYRDGVIAFHCASVGHKIDALRACDKVSFCVVSQDEVMPKERTTAFVSVIAFGRARLVDDEAQQRKVCRWIAEKFCPNDLEACQKETDETVGTGRLLCVEIDVEQITGKAGRQELKRRRAKAQGV